MDKMNEVHEQVTAAHSRIDELETQVAHLAQLFLSSPAGQALSAQVQTSEATLMTTAKEQLAALATKVASALSGNETPKV